MKAVKMSTRERLALERISRSVSFSSDRLSKKKNLSKDRERYIKQLTEQALSAVSA